MANILTALLAHKSSVSKKKRKIIEDAAKKIRKLEKMKSARTSDVERRTGVKSDIQKRQRDIAIEARKKLMVLTG